VIGENKERWRELCEQALEKDDPKKLLELVREINRLLKDISLLLEEKEQRLMKEHLDHLKKRRLAS
jgi:hypothetical protein